MKQKSPTLHEKMQAVKLMAQWSWQTSPSFTIVILIITTLAGLIGIIEPYIFKLLIDRLVGDASIAEGVMIAAGGITLAFATRMAYFSCQSSRRLRKINERLTVMEGIMAESSPLETRTDNLAAYLKTQYPDFDFN